MNRQQKIAKFNLIVALTAISLSLTAFGIAYFIVGLPAHRALGGFGFLGVIGLTGFSPILYKKSRDKVTFDERDLTIQRKASLVAYSIFWVLFVLAAMVPFFIPGPKGTISVKYLPAMIFGGWFVVLIIQSIVTLEEYGWSDKGEKS